jgi:hypothetical protein
LLVDMVAVVMVVVVVGLSRFEWMFCFAAGCTRGFDMHLDSHAASAAFYTTDASRYCGGAGGRRM